ncbi:MAG: sulfatase-like hydrolase/transferase [Candidatus Eisenbacteria bacterium]|nr:sulfatase-like hydrolase/transferase [Candidatus Eisenbacteria bacterium]
MRPPDTPMLSATGERQGMDMSRSGARVLPLLLRLFAAAIVSLWTIDVLVNLQLTRSVFLGNTILGEPSDFLGLLLAETQVALAAAVAALLAGLVIGAIRRRPSRGPEAVAALSALMLGVAVLVKTPEWRGLLPTTGSKLVFSSGASLAAWLVLRPFLGRRAGLGRSLAPVVGWALLPALVSAFLLDSLDHAFSGSFAPSAVSGVAVVALLVIGLASFRAGVGRCRRLAVWIPVFAALALACHSCASFTTCGASDRAEAARGDTGRPHIFLIVLDTVRADHLSCYGYSRDTMPGLERWARDGVTFLRAISPAGWTSPAHASFFSGRTVSEHGVHARSGPGAGAAYASLPLEGVAWLPEILRKEGYYCVAVSANSMALPRGITGFDRAIVPRRNPWHHATAASRADSWSPLARRLNELLRWRMPYVDARGIAAIARRSLSGVEKPLFAFINFLDPHGPYNPPEAALRSLKLNPEPPFPRYLQHRDITCSWNDLPEGAFVAVNELYDGELRWLDTNLAPLLRWIEERYGDRAVVIVTSDHGEELGESGRVGHEYGVGQSIIHVPLFIRAPGLAPGRVTEIVNLRHLFDLILHCARGGPTELSRLLDTQAPGLVSERYPSTGNARVLGSEYERAWVSLIEGKYKAVGPSDRGLELYDIESMGFDHEVPADASGDESRLADDIDAYWEEARDPRLTRYRTLSAEQREALRSLGYLE